MPGSVSCSCRSRLCSEGPQGRRTESPRRATRLGMMSVGEAADAKLRTMMNRHFDNSEMGIFCAV